MPYNSLIDRTDAAALIPEDVSREIIQSVPESSNVLRLARRLPNMTRKQQRVPVLSLFPTAYFVDGDTGLKQTTEQQWTNKYINAEEIAVIVPIPEAVLDDADYDIWGEVRPRAVEAIGKVIDGAVLIGTNAPSAWPDDLKTAATAAGNNVVLGSVGADLYDDIMDEGGLLSKVELDGFMVNGHLAHMTMRGKLRGLRDLQGQPIFKREGMQGASQYTLDGDPVAFDRLGGFTAADALMFSGDWNQLVYSIRQDITYKVLDQAVIQDNTGAIVYNLAQQDMVALRIVIRLGWQLPNPMTQLQQTEANRYPFSVLLPV